MLGTSGWSVSCSKNSHGRRHRRFPQRLLLRGRTQFISISDYSSFLIVSQCFSSKTESVMLASRCLILRCWQQHYFFVAYCHDILVNQSHLLKILTKRVFEFKARIAVAAFHQSDIENTITHWLEPSAVFFGRKKKVGILCQPPPPPPSGMEEGGLTKK